MIAITTNIASLDAQRNLSNTQMKLNTALSQLSSGYRINGSADDAAGLAISETLKAQVTGDNQAARNAQDGISMVQTADGAMNEQQAMLQRVRELGVQSSNDTLSTKDRGNVNAELQALLAEFNGISARTQFNGQTLLNGSLTTTQSGGTAIVGAQFNTTGGNASIASIDASGAKAGDTYTMSSAAAGTLTMTRTSDSVAQTITLAAVAANSSNALNFSQLGITINASTDGAGKTAAGLATDLTAATITTAAASSSASAQLQIGANSSDTTNVAFQKVGIDATTTGFTALFAALSTFNTHAGAGTASSTDGNALISATDLALATLSTTRASLGAVQNRLTHTIANLNVTSQNLAQSNSRIRDVDVAASTAAMTSANVLMQAGVSVLAQSNQLPQLALKLLG